MNAIGIETTDVDGVLRSWNVCLYETNLLHQKSLVWKYYEATKSSASPQSASHISLQARGLGRQADQGQ